jgi:hypothetical protein
MLCRDMVGIVEDDIDDDDADDDAAAEDDDAAALYVKGGLRSADGLDIDEIEREQRSYTDTIAGATGP